jgi:putative SOS response-associated peptidase YedK
MCGRFTLTAPTEVLKQFFPLFDQADEGPEAVPPRYNIAPTQMVMALRHLPQAARPEFTWLRWGLIPAWADDVKIGARLINARAETAAAKPAFRDAFFRRRCLVLADGFYEWRKLAGRKQPYYVRMTDARPFAFAGLWERWDKGEQPVQSCTILTTDANELMQPIHDRMPVILDAPDYQSWLDPTRHESAELEPCLRPFPSERLTAYPVGNQVNNARFDDKSCVQAAKDAKDVTLFAI